jgi:hypothetical protein
VLQMRGSRAQPAQHFDVSPPLAQMPPAARPAHKPVDRPPKRIPRPPASQQTGKAVHDVALQGRVTALQGIPPPKLVFDGIGNGLNGFTPQAIPPDTNGDVGPNHYVQVVNTDVAVFTKNGSPLLGPVPLNTLWSGFGGGCETNDDGDPVVIYDPIADRWVISQFSVSGADGSSIPFLECVAISQTADPTGRYNRYSFAYSQFPDYPKMGVWPDAYYTTFNMFHVPDDQFLGAQICAYDRASMLAGQPATQQCFQVSIGGLLPADLDGATLPPAGAPNYALALGAAANQLAFFAFHVDWTTPANSTLTGPTNLTTADFTDACSPTGRCVPQSGTTELLDSLGDRLMFRLAYRNFGDHEAMVVSHSINAGTSTGVRWYELRLSAGSPSIFQQGTYAPSSDFRWMPSIAMDQGGNMLMGFSVSGNALKPQLHYTGRLVADALGQMRDEKTYFDGSGSQASFGRWGDYSMMSVDPADDSTFWFTSEYLPFDGVFNWRTRIAALRLRCDPACTDKSTCCNGRCVNLVIDHNNCGQCGNACSSDSICRGGICRTCPEGQIACANECESPRTCIMQCQGRKCPPGTQCCIGPEGKFGCFRPPDC